MELDVRGRDKLVSHGRLLSNHNLVNLRQKGPNSETILNRLKKVSFPLLGACTGLKFDKHS